MIVCPHPPTHPIKKKKNQNILRKCFYLGGLRILYLRDTIDSRMCGSRAGELGSETTSPTLPPPQKIQTFHSPRIGHTYPPAENFLIAH